MTGLGTGITVHTGALADDVTRMIVTREIDATGETAVTAVRDTGTAMTATVGTVRIAAMTTTVGAVVTAAIGRTAIEEIVGMTVGVVGTAIVATVAVVGIQAVAQTGGVSTLVGAAQVGAARGVAVSTPKAADGTSAALVGRGAQRVGQRVMRVPAQPSQAVFGQGTLRKTTSGSALRSSRKRRGSERI